MVIMDRRPSGKAAVLSFPETERLSSANLMAVPMYLQHGFTSICTASALAETGALRYMMEHERWSLRSLCEGLKLQPGYTKSCVHLLVSLDLLVDEGGGGYRRGRDFDDFVRLPFESIGGTSEAFKTTHLRLDESSLGPSVLAIFQGLGCAERVPISYYPMFQELPKILMGDGSIFAAQEADGHEVHVDRVLNPLEDQPAAVADMGCGDGRLLLTLYEYVRDHTKRGKHLDKFPFTVIGIDFNGRST
ncbi:acetyltransferase [Aureococcus anophagefferens]|nr:acetyltransferase [Aureococcus anophagefferens]